MDKKELRIAVKADRKAIKDKVEKDRLIIEKLKSLSCYREAKKVLCYLSLDAEIKTDEIIDYSLKTGKRVAVPFCVDKEGNMEFYLINSIDDTKTGSFNIREPNTEKCLRLDDFSNSIIIVPGLCFDKNGNRLGYGKGYYDRFLKKYSLISVGLCYNSLVKNEIPVNEYDEKVDYIVTEDLIINVKDGGKNG